MALALAAAGCGSSDSSVPTASDCGRWLPPAQVRGILGAASIKVVTEATGATGHLDAGGVICEYEGFPTSPPAGPDTSLFLLDMWPHVQDAPRVYEDYVKGLSGPTSRVAGLGDAATRATGVTVVLAGTSVFAIGTNDTGLAREVAGRI